MKTTIFKLAGLLFLSAILFSFTQKQADWVSLGSRTVNMTADHDEIMVTAADGTFTKIKIQVTKAPLHIFNCKIVFGNGEEKEVDIKQDFAKGSGTRVIDLPGEKRVIKKIIFNYKSVPTAKGKAIVTVFGKH